MTTHGSVLIGTAIVAGLVAVSAAAIRRPAPAPGPGGTPAPELTNTSWLNSDKPLRLAELRGGSPTRARHRGEAPDRRGGARDESGQQHHSNRRIPHHFVSASGAAPKLTLNRRHQIDTARYLVRSNPSGTS